MPTNIEVIAREFSKQLALQMTPEEIAQAIESNRDESDKNICHTHDYIDANMAMAAAFEKLGVNTDDHAIWSSAWNLAVSNEFYHADGKSI